MEKTELIAPLSLGNGKQSLKREITDLGYEISRVEDGKVTFFGDARAVAGRKYFSQDSGPDPVESGRNPGGDF